MLIANYPAAANYAIDSLWFIPPALQGIADASSQLRNYLAEQFKANGGLPPDLDKIAREAYDKGWRKEGLLGMEKEFSRFSRELPRVKRQVDYVSDPSSFSAAFFSMKKYFSMEKNSQVFQINLACDIKGVSLERLKKIARHEALHAFDVNFIIDRYKQDCFLYLFGGLELNSLIFNQRRIDYVKEVIGQKQLKTPLTKEEFEEKIKKFSAEEVYEKLSEVVVWANCDESFKDVLEYGFKLEVKDLSKQAVFDVKSLKFFLAHPIKAAYYTVLLEKYGFADYVKEIKSLFLESNSQFEDLYKIYLTQWMAAEAKPLKFDKAN